MLFRDDREPGSLRKKIVKLRSRAGRIIVDLENAPAGFAENAEDCLVKKRGAGGFYYPVINIDVGDFTGHMPQVVIGDTVHLFRPLSG
jgi:hypothetical protein